MRCRWLVGMESRAVMALFCRITSIENLQTCSRGYPPNCRRLRSSAPNSSECSQNRECNRFHEFTLFLLTAFIHDFDAMSPGSGARAFFYFTNWLLAVVALSLSAVVVHDSPVRKFSPSLFRSL